MWWVYKKHKLRGWYRLKCFVSSFICEAFKLHFLSVVNYLMKLSFFVIVTVIGNVSQIFRQSIKIYVNLFEIDILVSISLKSLSTWLGFHLKLARNKEKSSFVFRSPLPQLFTIINIIRLRFQACVKRFSLSVKTWEFMMKTFGSLYMTRAK